MYSRRILQTHDSLSVSSGKLQIYKALCNPAYICNTTDDPILAAFKLSKELKIAGAVDSLFRKEYYELSEQTRIFTADLMSKYFCYVFYLENFIITFIGEYFEKIGFNASESIISFVFFLFLHTTLLFFHFNQFHFSFIITDSFISLLFII